MQQTSEPAFGTPQPLSRPRRIARYLGRRLLRRVIFPGDSLADAVKRTAYFVIGWGAFIGLLAWGAYRQGFLHGVGDGIVFCGVFFGLAVLTAPDFVRPGGSQRPDHY
jgi:hypothetical protein